MGNWSGSPARPGSIAELGREHVEHVVARACRPHRRRRARSQRARDPGGRPRERRAADPSPAAVQPTIASAPTTRDSTSGATGGGVVRATRCVPAGADRRRHALHERLAQRPGQAARAVHARSHARALHDARPRAGRGDAGGAFVTLDPYTAARSPKLVAAPRRPTWRNLETLDAIAETSASTVLTAHGPPWTGGAAEGVRQARAARHVVAISAGGEAVARKRRSLAATLVTVDTCKSRQRGVVFGARETRSFVRPEEPRDGEAM